MSKTLIVVRHGHAEDGEVDYARRLSDRGVAEVNGAGEILAEQGVTLNGVLSSSAPRAADTAAMVARHCCFSGAVKTTDQLYLAEPVAILKQVCATSEPSHTLLLVGHNPGLSAFVERLTGHPCELRTAQVVHLELDVNHWGDISFA